MAADGAAHKRPRLEERVEGVAATATSSSSSSAARGDAVDHVAVYPGEEGSLAHIAATKFFSPSTGRGAEGAEDGTRLRGVDSFASAFREVAEGRALYAVVPIENSASGTLHKTYDLLFEHDVAIGGELGVREVYCLCVRDGGGGAGLSGVRRVLSHPNILEACSAFLDLRLARAVRGGAAPGAPGGADVETLATISTTEAARRVSQAEEPPGVVAAIATKQAARRFGLSIIAEDIGNDAFLETRYILIHRRGGPAAERLPPFPSEALDPLRKRSACFALTNEPGSIFKLLSCWALRGLDILKVETRPLGAGRRAPPGLSPSAVRLWDYLFYVDYAVPVGMTPEAHERLWTALGEFSLWSKDLGAYPSQITRVEKTAQSWADMVDIMAKA